MNFTYVSSLAAAAKGWAAATAPHDRDWKTPHRASFLSRAAAVAERCCHSAGRRGEESGCRDSVSFPKAFEEGCLLAEIEECVGNFVSLKVFW